MMFLLKYPQTFLQLNTVCEFFNFLFKHIFCLFKCSRFPCSLKMVEMLSMLKIVNPSIHKHYSSISNV